MSTLNLSRWDYFTDDDGRRHFVGAVLGWIIEESGNLLNRNEDLLIKLFDKYEDAHGVHISLPHRKSIIKMIGD